MTSGEKDYRLKLYEHYLTTQVQTDLTLIHQDLESRAPYLRSVIRRWFPGDFTVGVLDLGCGYGALLYFLKEAGYCNLKGIDCSSEQVAVAKKLGLDFVQQGAVTDALRMSKDGEWDILIAFDVIEHLSKGEVLTFVDEAKRVLKTGGRLLIHVPNGEAIFSGTVYFGDLSHETGFTRRSLKQLMSVGGFSQVHVIEDVPTIHGIISLLRYVLWKIIRTAFRLIYIVETGDKHDPVLSQNLLAVVEKE